MEYRRIKISGGTYFLTLVTYKRQKILCSQENINLLKKAFKYILGKHSFKIDAIIILPDHIHTIWTLPENDYDYSLRIRLFKTYFSRNCQIDNKAISNSRKAKNEKAIWQRRFWEHAIRDQKDFNNHCDYIHYNAVKHKLVKSPKDWPYSSFHNFVKNGYYDIYWGVDIDKGFDKIGKE